MIKIDPAPRLRGDVVLPGDKSIAHRYAMLGAIAGGETQIENFSSSQDCEATLQCLLQLGVTIRHQGSTVAINSEGWEKFQRPEGILDAQNSGTTIRLISALLSSCPFVSTIQGDESLNRRPMKRIIVPLTLMGADIQAHDGQFPPLTIQGGRLQGIVYSLPVPSAQVKSSILLAGLMAQGKTTVIENTPSRDHTERALPYFGAILERKDRRLQVTGEIPLHGTSMQIPGDFSAAVYFILAALLVPGSKITMCHVGINPTRTAVLDLVKAAGAAIEEGNHRQINGEPVCDLAVSYSPEVFERLSPEVSADLIPNLIDEIPVLAVFGTCLRRGFCVKGAGELRNKESDRIHSMAVNLHNLGIEIEEQPEGFYIPPGQSIRGGQVRTFGDHRVAMSFAVAGLIAKEPVEIDNPDCAAVSFPDFFKNLDALRG